MSNDFFSASGNPATGSPGSSATIRAEFAAIKDAFDKMPALTGQGNKVVRINAAGNAMEATDTLTALTITTATINGGTINNTTIGGVTPAAGAFTTLSTTGAATLDSGTVGGADLVSISATQTLTNKTINLSSNTLTATSAQLAAAVTDETGSGALVFGTSPTISTPAITGGTINNAVIGGTTRAAGNFTTLDANGNVILGDATTDTVTVNGYVGVGGAAQAYSGLTVGSSALTGALQYGGFFNPVGTSSATTALIGVRASPQTAAAAFTVVDQIGFYATNQTKGAGSTITNQHGVYITDQTQGTNNFGITSLVSSGANKWNIYASGTAANYFAGNVGIGTSSPAGKLEVNTSTGVAYFTRTAGDNGTSASAMSIANPAGTAVAIGASGALAFNVGAVGTDANSQPERLRITSTGNVGIGTNSPGARLEVRGAEFPGSTFNGQIIGDSTARLRIGYKDGTVDTGLVPAQIIAGTTLLQIASRDNSIGAIAFYSGTGVPERMRITSAGNVGIGTNAPARRLTVSGAAGTSTIAVQDANTGSAATDGFQIQLGSAGEVYLWNYENAFTAFGTNNTERLRIDSSGNLGLGVVPSAWSMTTLQIAARGAVSADTNTIGISQNVQGSLYSGFGALYADSSLYALTYELDRSSGSHKWKTAPQGTAGNAISFTQAMTLDASGNLGIGTSSPGAGLDVANGFIWVGAKVASPGLGGNVRHRDDSANLRWVTGLLGSAGATSYSIYDNLAGQERFVIDSSGNVGIGTNSPSAKLDVRTAAGTAVTQYLFTGSNAAASTLQFGQTGAVGWNVGITATNGHFQIGVDGGGLGYNINRIGTAIEYHSWLTAGTERMRIDTSGNVLVTNNTGGLGYGTGAGGSVTQATSKTTAVTLNRPTGVITMNAEALGAGARVTFVCNNSLVTSNDTIVCNFNYGAGSPANYLVRGDASSGGIIFTVKNDSGGSLSEAVVINFAVIKGSST